MENLQKYEHLPDLLKVLESLIITFCFHSSLSQASNLAAISSYF